jgi:RimJ/RimL family protein N-acetyltransferase
VSDEVRLRDVEQSDLRAFFEQEQDPEALRRSQFTPRDWERFVAHWNKEILEDETVHVQAISIDGKPGGHVVAWWQGDRRFIGYWLAREHWGKGLGTQALRLFLQAETTRPLYADPFGGNEASIRVLEKLGFRKAGTVRHGQNEHVMLVLNGDE